jgi:hypothetical protein
MDFLTLLPNVAFCYVEERADYKTKYSSIECMVDFTNKADLSNSFKEF